MPYNPPVLIRDEGTDQGAAPIIDFTGAGVSAAVASGIATVTIAGAAGGGLTLTAFSQDLGVGDSSGTFDITGLSGLTTDKPVMVMQTAAPITTKGDARDEFEFDAIHATGYVVNSTTIRVYWWAANIVVGTYNFAYGVSA